MNNKDRMTQDRIALIACSPNAAYIRYIYSIRLIKFLRLN